MPDKQRPGGPRGVYFRGRLPHFDIGEVAQTITFRLADSMPDDALERIESELRAFASDERAKRKRARIDALLDAGRGDAFLADDAAGAIVQETLLFHAGERYDLHAWVVMPNHVHVVITPDGALSLGKIVQSWKLNAARRLNSLRGRTGSVWATGYFDRYIRDPTHFDAAVHYAEQNPVRAGLCRDARDWRWGSASQSGDGASV